MGSRQIVFCDLCGREVDGQALLLSVNWDLGLPSDPTRQDACVPCINRLTRAVQEILAELRPKEGEVVAR